MFPAGRHHGCDANLLDTIVKGDHLSTMVTKFGSNWSLDFRGEGHCHNGPWMISFKNCVRWVRVRPKKGASGKLSLTLDTMGEHIQKSSPLKPPIGPLISEEKVIEWKVNNGRTDKRTTDAKTVYWGNKIICYGNKIIWRVRVRTKKGASGKLSLTLDTMGEHIQKSSPLKPPGQLESNLVTIVLGRSPFKIVPGKSVPYLIQDGGKRFCTNFEFCCTKPLKQGFHGQHKIFFYWLNNVY
jgi:hypothetical protein